MDRLEMDYRQAIDYILSLTNHETLPGDANSREGYTLDRTYRLLELLGNPHLRFPSVHLAGTKGKGSTAAMIESILRHSHHVTGLYTSPHLHTFRERIRYNGDRISQQDVMTGIGKIKSLESNLPGLTTFEVMTGLAFDYFAERQVNVAVLEVGLGGRLDSTNVVTPLVSIITPVSYDHTAILGKTLGEIAGEKAGIIKPDVPVISSPQDAEARAVIEQAARERMSPLTTVSGNLTFNVSGQEHQLVPKEHDLNRQTLVWRRQGTRLGEWIEQRLDLPLLGRHQLTNAATAIAAVLVLREGQVKVPDDAIIEGLGHVSWPGRFEVLSRRPYLIVDGAHNQDSARKLAETLNEYFPQCPLHLVFGASNDKDIDGMFAELLPHAASVVLTRSRNPRSADPTRLADHAAKYGVRTLIAPDVSSALKETLARVGTEDVICITGSLFVVGDAREAWFHEHGAPVETDL